MIELSYDLRFYELHGRDLENPWSCRRCAIYQKFNVQTTNSTWILLQIPEVFKKELLNLLTGSTGFKGHPLTLHLRYLKSCGNGWRRFLAYMSQELSQLVRRPGMFTPTYLTDISL